MTNKLPLLTIPVQLGLLNFYVILQLFGFLTGSPPLKAQRDFLDDGNEIDLRQDKAYHYSLSCCKI